MEWNAKTDKFEKKFPAPSPIVNAKVTILRDVHEKYGFRCKNNLRARIVVAVADTGC